MPAHFRVLTDAAPLKRSEAQPQARRHHLLPRPHRPAPLKLLAGLGRSGAANPHFRVLTDAAPLKRPWY